MHAKESRESKPMHTRYLKEFTRNVLFLLARVDRVALRAHPSNNKFRHLD